jgi:hypothetical protein
MSAVATKKVGGDYATQLTFPAVFEEQYKKNGLASQFYPEQRTAPVVLSRGSGIQEDYHEQKRLDANRRCLNGVKDTAASTARFLRSHANYIMPKPVLSQRIFANPSNGNQADIYSNRPVFRLSGGVLRTKEGQEYGMRKLKERIPQLDAIDAAKEAFLMGMPSAAMGAEDVGVFDITAKVELYGLLTLVESDVEQSTATPDTVNRSQSALKMMFSFIPIADVSEVEEVMAKVEVIQRALGGIEENYEDGQGDSDEGRAMLKNVIYLKALFDRMRQYLVRMNGVIGRPRKEKEKASSIFIKSLGFSELEKLLPKPTAAEKKAMARAAANNPSNAPEAPVVDDRKYDDEVLRAPVFQQSDSASSFSPSLLSPSLFAPDRFEDEPEFDVDQRFDRTRLTDDQRQKRGEESGEYVDAPSSSANAAAQMMEEERVSAMPSFSDVSRGKQEALSEEVSAVSALSPAEQAELEKLRSTAQADQEQLERERENKRTFPEAIQFMTAQSLDDQNLEATKAQLKANGLYLFGKATGSALKTYIKANFLDKGKRFTTLQNIDKLEKRKKRLDELEAKARGQRTVRRTKRIFVDEDGVPIVDESGAPMERFARRPERGDVSASASASSSSSGMGKMGKMGKGKMKRDENFFANLLKMLVGKDRNVEH